MTDPVKLLSDDEVDRIQQLPVTMNGNVEPEPSVVLTTYMRDALCATVRALRAADKHHYQLWLDLKERHQHKFASADGQWADTCQQCGVTTGDDHDGYDCIAWLQRTLAENARRHFDDARELERQRDKLKDQLAQVTQERDGDRQLNTVATSVSIKSTVQCIDATIRFTVPVNLQAKLRGHINELILLLRHRAIQLCRSKAADYQAARDEAYAGVPTCDAVGENEIRKAVASQLAAELERDLLN